MWPKTNNMKIEPPAPKVMPGRPKKKRRKDKDEPRKKYGKLSKKGVQMTCSTCHQLGHNKKSCPVTKGGSGRGSGQSSSAQKMPRGSGESSSAQKRPTGSGESVGLKRGRGSGQSSSAQKRPKNAGLGCYINPTTGRTVINSGSSSERVVRHGTMRDDVRSTLILDLKLLMPKFKGKSLVTTTRLRRSRNGRNITTNKPSTHEKQGRSQFGNYESDFD
ncbi:uncharacterized protein LOC132057974 [Lycium ferocissimum]|uniref:uncharacterized protein LOC132057974 n=1 Tax=Lycium ferocissimum TaxID=112874 RepID=UPI002815EC85|nr:uncharacterized protein LOC132057974 [Lycium ferocissimum]